jgi:hypothetical protein
MLLFLPHPCQTAASIAASRAFSHSITGKLMGRLWASVGQAFILTVQKKNYSEAAAGKEGPAQKFTPDPIAGRIAGGGEAQ